MTGEPMSAIQELIDNAKELPDYRWLNDLAVAAEAELKDLRMKLPAGARMGVILPPKIERPFVIRDDDAEPAAPAPAGGTLADMITRLKTYTRHANHCRMVTVAWGDPGQFCSCGLNDLCDAVLAASQPPPPAEGEVTMAESLLQRLYTQIGNHAPAERRHAVTPGLRDAVRDYLKENGLLLPLPASPPAEAAK